MRIVFDTNVLIAAFISHGHCHELLEYAVCHHKVLTSRYILTEFKRTLLNKFNYSRRIAREAADLLVSRLAIVEVGTLPASGSRDPNDDPILATTLSAAAHCLVTGDKDLLVLKQVQKIPIITPAAFWAFEADKLSPKKG